VILVSDTDNSGYIDIGEFAAALKMMQIESVSDDEMKAVIAAADPSCDGLLEYKELLAMIKSKGAEVDKDAKVKKALKKAGLKKAGGADGAPEMNDVDIELGPVDDLAGVADCELRLHRKEFAAAFNYMGNIPARELEIVLKHGRRALEILEHFYFLTPEADVEEPSKAVRVSRRMSARSSVRSSVRLSDTTLDKATTL